MREKEIETETERGDGIQSKREGYTKRESVKTEKQQE